MERHDLGQMGSHNIVHGQDWLKKLDSTQTRSGQSGWAKYPMLYPMKAMKSHKMLGLPSIQVNIHSSFLNFDASNPMFQKSCNVSWSKPAIFDGCGQPNNKLTMVYITHCDFGKGLWIFMTLCLPYWFPLLGSLCFIGKSSTAQGASAKARTGKSTRFEIARVAKNTQRTYTLTVQGTVHFQDAAPMKLNNTKQCLCWFSRIWRDLIEWDQIVDKCYLLI